MRHRQAWKYLAAIFIVFWILFAIILIVSAIPFYQTAPENPWHQPWGCEARSLFGAGVERWSGFPRDFPPTLC